MKIDLCKLFGVEEGEKFKIEGLVDIYVIQNGYLYFIDDYGKQKSFFNTIKDVVERSIIKLPKKKKFSQDTLNFFKCIDKEFKWIAKDKNDDVHTFYKKPMKGRSYWLCNYQSYISKVFNQDIFDQILWEDEEPVCIDDYVER